MSDVARDHRRGPFKPTETPHRFGSRGLVLEALAFNVLIGITLSAATLALAPVTKAEWRLPAIALVLFAAISFAAIMGLRFHPHPRFGAANVVTSVRAAMTALTAALIVEIAGYQADGDGAFSWLVAGIVFVALALDGVDGYLARRFDQESAFGARFDMEVDALLILLLSVFAFVSNEAGAYVLLLGTMRYAYLLLHALWPALSKELTPSLFRKTVCVIQVGALCAIATPVVEPPLSPWIALAALGFLLASFGRDLGLQVRRSFVSEGGPL